jgi:hypothetical protein
MKVSVIRSAEFGDKLSTFQRQRTERSGVCDFAMHGARMAMDGSDVANPSVTL